MSNATLRCSISSSMCLEGGIRFNCAERPVGRLWFETQKSQLNPDHVRYVESVLGRCA